MKTPDELKAYRRAASSKWRKNHPEEDKRRKREYNKKLWLEFLAAYGTKCACGESDITALTIGHLNGDGAAHRKAVGLGRNAGVNVILDLRRKNWPKDIGIATQCANCQIRQVRNR